MNMFSPLKTGRIVNMKEPDGVWKQMLVLPRQHWQSGVSHRGRLNLLQHLANLVLILQKIPLMRLLQCSCWRLCQLVFFPLLFFLFKITPLSRLCGVNLAQRESTSYRQLNCVQKVCFPHENLIYGSTHRNAFVDKRSALCKSNIFCIKKQTHLTPDSGIVILRIFWYCYFRVICFF